jgi:K+-transporting ATPase KdpF subunit
MSALEVVGLVLAAALFAYLGYALVRGENL